MRSNEGRRRHCMVVHAYYPLGETRVQREAMALLDHGFDVHVICLRGDGEPRRDEHDGVQITRLPVGRHRGSGFAMQLLEYLLFFVLAAIVLTVQHLRRRYDSIQVHNLPDFLVFAALIPKLMGTPVILDLHDLMPEFFAARTEKPLDSTLVRIVALQELLSCRFADHVITVTDAWKETLIDRGVARHKVSVVMNVADARLFQAPASPPSHQDDRFVVIYHGTFTHRYGVDLIVDAIDVLRDSLPSVHATLLGDGDLRDEIVDRIRALGLEDRVTVSPGMVGAEELPAALAASDVGVVPNRNNVFTDGILPTKLLEYVAMNVPVIAARTTTVESYFDDKQLEYFAPGDAADLAHSIEALAVDPGRRRELADNAAAFNLEYSWEAISADYAANVGRLIRG